MHVFVINLATAAERLRYMSDQLSGRFERIDAVRGRAVPSRLANNFKDPTPLLPGEIGCYASHLVTAETILERGLPYAAVLEDDVQLADDFHKLIDEAVAQVDGEWDILSLSGAKQHPHFKIAPISPEHHLVHYLHFPKTTAAYVISASGCRKLLATRRRTRPVDVDIRYGWEMDVNGYGVFPPPAWQTNQFASSIPKAKKQRFYWRADPLGYLKGRTMGIWKMGPVRLARAYLQDMRPSKSPSAQSSGAQSSRRG